MHATTHEPRSVIRILLVLTMVVAMVATGFAPALAGESSGEEDIETVRAKVTGTFDYKIGLLSDKKAGTDNAEKAAAYQSGIDKLVHKRDNDVANATSIEALWALDDEAHSIYYEAKDAASKVGQTDADKVAEAKKQAADTAEYKIKLLKEWIAGCDDPTAQKIVATGVSQLEALFPLIDKADTVDKAYSYKDQAHSIYHSTIDAAEKAKGEEEEKPKEPTAEEKAAAALKSQRNSTLSLIFKKTALLESAAEAAKLAEVSEIYAAASAAVEDLEDDARGAGSISALQDISAQVMEIYEKAKKDVEGVEVAKDEGPADSVGTYLDSTTDWAYAIVAAATDTAERSPDTFDDLVDAKKALVAAADDVRAAIEAEKNVRDAWNELHDAMRSFRRALVRHYIALGEPLVLGDLHIAG